MPNQNQVIVGDGLSKDFHERAKKMIADYKPNGYVDRSGHSFTAEQLEEIRERQEQWFAEHGMEAMSQFAVQENYSIGIDNAMEASVLTNAEAEGLPEKTIDDIIKPESLPVSDPNFNRQVKVWIAQHAPAGQFINRHMQETAMKKVMQFILDQTPTKKLASVVFEEKVERFLKRKWITIYIDYYLNNKPYREKFRDPRSKVRLPDDYDMHAESAQIVDGKLNMIPETVKIVEG